MFLSHNVSWLFCKFSFVFLYLDFLFRWDPYTYTIGKTLTVILIPLALGLFFALVFYWKSIKIMKSQSEYEQKSTVKFIRILSWFSISQLLTYGPSIFFQCFLVGVIFFEGKWFVYLVDSCAGIANLAGFINVMIFVLQGSMRYNNRSSIDHLDLDLTKDV